MTASKHTFDVVRGYLNRPITLNKLNLELFKVSIERGGFYITAGKADLIKAGLLESGCFPGEEGNKKYTQRVIYKADGCKVLKDKNKIDDSLIYAYVSKYGKKFELKIYFDNRFRLNPNVVFTDVIVDSKNQYDGDFLYPQAKRERFNEWSDDEVPGGLKPTIRYMRPETALERYRVLDDDSRQMLSALSHSMAVIQGNREIALKKKVVSIKDIKEYKENYFRCKPYYYVEYPKL